MANVTFTHHREKPTDHPLRMWRKSQRPRIPLELLATALGCTRAHLSLIEHYGTIPGYLLALRISLVTGLDLLWMVSPARVAKERKYVERQYRLALEDYRSRQARRER